MTGASRVTTVSLTAVSLSVVIFVIVIVIVIVALSTHDSARDLTLLIKNIQLNSRIKI